MRPDVRLMPISHRGALWRFLLAAVIVILFSATTTAVAGLLQVKQLASDLGRTPAIKHARITIADAGAPQTLLLIGSDHRAGEPFGAANTDTMMLVRLDAASSTINVVSVPRDLRVQLPRGGATAKLNAAYSIGGPNLLVKTLQSQVFPDLIVNHIIDVNFGGFKALVNAVGCAYTDVDHRYYNDTLYTNYSSIDIQPGYQRLCGDDALAFVRFRHTDTDIVRNARQQDFLRWAKSQFGTSELIAERDRLLSIFGQHAQTDADLHSLDGILKMFDLVAFSAGHTVKQIPFPAILLPCNPAGGSPCYVTADALQEQHAFEAFMTPTLSQPQAAGPAPEPPASAPRVTAASASYSQLVGALPEGRAQAQSLGHVAMPVMIPSKLASGSRYCTGGTCTEGPIPGSYPRAYTLQDQSGRPHAAYRLTVVLNPLLGQYYGIEGTSWQRPPILNGPSQVRFVAGKRLQLFSGGQKLTLVAWHTPTGLYWLSNTLTGDLTNAQMIGIAASFTRP